MRQRTAFMHTHNIRVAGYLEDEEQQGHSRHAVEHGRIHQGLYRVDPHKIDDEPDDGGNGDNAIETVGLFELKIKTGIPVKRLGYRISRRPRQHRHSQQPQPDDTY